MFTDYKKAFDIKKKVWVQHPDGKKEEVDSSRLYRFTGDKGWRLKDYSADFRLADSDDFFGFSEIKENVTIKDVLLTIAGLVVLWWVLVLWFSF